MMRQPNGTSSSVQQSHFGSTSQPGMVAQSPMLPTKSPMVTHKPLHPPPGPSPSSSSNQSVPNSVSGGSVPSSNLKSNLNGGGDSSSVGLDKAKDSTKMFPTKTYNHIKDMISSRFGNNNSSSNSAGLPPKGLNNSNVVNNNANTSNNATSSQNGNVNGGFTMNGQNGTHSYMESTSSMGGMPTYGLNQHGHIHSHSIHDTFGGSPPAAPYYTSPPAVSPQNGTGNVNGGGAPNMNGSANSYRSPPMNDRKNVNTSFRKAIHQSTLKSNLTEESLQLRPIMEVSNLNGSANRDVYHRGMQQYSQQQQNGEQGQPRYGLGHEPPSPSLIPHHVERAQRALDKLCEPGGPPFTRTGSGPMTHQNGIGRMVQQFSGSGNAVDEIGISANRPMYSLNTKIGAISSASSGASQLTTGGGELGAIPRNRFSVTPGPSSSASNSSGGLGASTLATTSGGGGAHTVESSLSSPSSSSYTHSSSGGGSGIFNKQSLAHQQHQAPTTSLLNGNSSKSGNNKSSTNNDQIPPPLPTSQKPEVSGASGHSHHLHFQNSNNSTSGNGNNSGSNNHHNTLGLPPVLPSVLVGEKRENGDGSSGTMENPSSANLHLVESTSSSPSSKGATCSSSSGAGPSGGTSNASSSALAVNKSKSEQLKKITADLHNLAISVAAEQHFHHNHHHHLQFASGSGSGSGGAAPNNNQSSNNNNSSSSECENKGSQRIGSGQSHTTSDSGVGTVMLTKSPLNSISDHETNCKSGGVGGGSSSADLLLGGDDHNVMDSVSSGKKSERILNSITIKNLSKNISSLIQIIL